MTYGNEFEPGVTSDIQKGSNIVSDTSSPATSAIVGQANLNDGTGNANEIYLIQSQNRAEKLFGTDSLLTSTVQDALDEGALPLYVVATEEKSQTEDLSSLASETGDLSEAPISERDGDVTFSVDGTEQSNKIVWKQDPHTMTPDTDEVIYNPINGKFNLGATPSSTADVEYTYYDYASAIDKVQTNSVAPNIDFLGIVSENPSVKSDGVVAATAEASDHNLFQTVVGGNPWLDVTADSPREVNDERARVIHPSRNSDGDSLIGSYIGKISNLGLSRTPIKQQLVTQSNLLIDLNESDRGTLIDKGIIPIQDKTNAVIIDDVVAVNVDDTDYDTRWGFNRLVLDYATERIKVNEKPFIGMLHNPDVRDALEDVVSKEISRLEQSGVIIDSTVNVVSQSATSAEVRIFINTAETLRNISNSITLGQ